ncbi:hypothetical protein J6590_088796 [Homalodisca vitripennis]|nr:hypothetical protein J6590_088796 [Homalodisca vitripennis]
MELETEVQAIKEREETLKAVKMVEKKKAWVEFNDIEKRKKEVLLDRNKILELKKTAEKDLLPYEKEIQETKETMKLVEKSINKEYREETELTCETALFELKLSRQTLQVLGVYRPPSGNLEQAIDILSDQLDRALGAGKQIVIMGDINVDNLVDSTEKTKVEEFLIPFNITRLNLPPTRVTRDTAKSVDWICTNNDPQQIQTSVIVSGPSDHTAQLATVITKKPDRRNIKEKNEFSTKKQ